MTADDHTSADSKPSDLIFGLDDRPPLAQSILVALQHVLAVLVGIVTPPLLISRALHLPSSDQALLVSMALLISGVGTLLQTSRLGPLGSGLLSIQGTSFVFVAPVIALARSSNLATVFGTCLVAALIPILLSPFIRWGTRLITPLVTGIVVTLIGLTLVQVGITSFGGGFAAQANGTFGSEVNLALAALVVTLIVFLNSSDNNWLRMTSVVLGLGGGWVAALLAGKTNHGEITAAAAYMVPLPLRYGFQVRWSALLPFGFLYLITAVESIGDLTATSMLTNQPIAGPLYFRRLRGGVLADGVTSLLAALFNSFPSTTFAQNNGVIQLTGVGSRHIGKVVGLILMLLGLSPMVGQLVGSIPEPVLGGATLVLFGSVAISGVRILSETSLDRRASTIAAVSIALGLGVTFTPTLVQGLPPLARDTLSSGIATGGLCALLLNCLLPAKGGGNLNLPGAKEE